MGTLTGIDISSAALVKIGSNPIQSFNDNTKEAQTAGELYPRISASILASYPWNFARYQMEMNQLVTSPTNILWSYAYQLPSNYLSMVNCFDQTGNTVSYYISDDQAWSNTTQLFADYVQVLPETSWPEYFIDLVISRCAWEFALPVTGIGMDIDRAIKEYEWKEKRARNIDANQNPPQKIITPSNSSLVRARFGFGA